MAKRMGTRGAGSLLRRAVSSLANALTRKRTAAPAQPKTGDGDGRVTKQARRTKRKADIPLDRIENTYTPTQTSLKSGFRASGADRSRDQEFAEGYADDRWNDEDRITNKSGDPRIGTHGRTYEPGEK